MTIYPSVKSKTENNEKSSTKTVWNVTFVFHSKRKFYENEKHRARNI